MERGQKNNQNVISKIAFLNKYYKETITIYEEA